MVEGGKKHFTISSILQVFYHQITHASCIMELITDLAVYLVVAWRISYLRRAVWDQSAPGLPRAWRPMPLSNICKAYVEEAGAVIGDDCRMQPGRASLRL
ncbi:hypothetical protein CYLTODRAFT_202539 [Cylindrobasidium torrendii FP15055 ss-10]|uniref:Uncharacterized protein n=1 Tax=Cylindrobasidium torrendii FP15055 ss-10 TaxID=1314674 RepID=A0A0D7BJ40_9AGAR|nr:hypothetical protein CYLTODRAFT_202539 [Cylindrobasidium torrendii FP15055 ss-10]